MINVPENKNFNILVYIIILKCYINIFANDFIVHDLKNTSDLH